MLTAKEVCFLTSKVVEVVVTVTTPSRSGGIVTSIPSGTASSFPVLTPNPNSTSSLATSANANLPSPIPSEIAVPGASYVYVGCFEGQYIQPITSSFTVGDVYQCALLCVGSTYFSMESGDECEWLPISRQNLNTNRNARHVRRCHCGRSGTGRRQCVQRTLRRRSKGILRRSQTVETRYTSSEILGGIFLLILYIAL